MNKTLLALALIALLFTLTFSVHHDSESNSVSEDSDASLDSDAANEPLMGGWTKINVDDVKDYEDALNYLRSQTNDLPQGSQIVRISRQVVAGLNYKFLFKYNNSYREIVVWQQLDGSFEVTGNQ